MRFLKITAALAALAMPVLATAPAAAQSDWTETRFERDGDEYVVRRQQVGETTRLKGYVVGKLVKFDLTVKGDRVRGSVNNSLVEFRRQDAVRLASR
ncbi:hypothetical protein SAMN06295912_14215 [Sphingomonas laterariae]|uniref:DUF5666 domain-containing protein n=1 Tax=Edaphosphingomonas laterariae TaxID=861865 RepID=A0A239JZT0_9SPHN|nr:hypothetical protein [Sphingomonas laterariae]SNT10952.1 hypothetical protein SAMN06295912_14215 [Sphingomonas laterariae]